MPFSLPSQFNTTAFALMSAGHTYIAREWTSDPQFKNLPKFVKTYARAGWYQGSILFLILALINYRWSRPVSSQEEEEEAV